MRPMTEQQQTLGPHAIGVQISGHDNHVTITSGAAKLTLAQRHLLKAVPTTDRELLLTEWNPDPAWHSASSN